MILFKDKFEPWQNLVIESRASKCKNCMIKVEAERKSKLFHLFVEDCKSQYAEKKLPNEFKVASIEAYNLNYKKYLEADVIMWWHNGYKKFYMTIRKVNGYYSEDSKQDFKEHKSFIESEFLKCIKNIQILDV